MLKIFLRGSPDGAQLAEILIHQTLAQQPRCDFHSARCFKHYELSQLFSTHNLDYMIFLDQGGNCSDGSAKPECGKGDRQKRGDGDDQHHACSWLLRFTQASPGSLDLHLLYNVQASCLLLNFTIIQASPCSLV